MKISQSQNIDFNSISAIIFDWGNVITDLEIEKCISAFQELGFTNIAKHLNDTRESNPFIQFETGKIQSKEFAQRISDDLGKTINPKLIESAWYKMLGHTPKIRLILLEILNTQFKTFLLSNTNPSHTSKYLTYLDQEMGFNFCTGFHQLYFSYQMGMMKPNPAIFQQVIDEQHLDVSKTLFLDDKLENIQAAQSLGIQCIQVTSDNPIEHIFKDFLKEPAMNSLAEKENQ